MRGASILLTVALLLAASLSAQSQVPYTSAELDELLGPIALYPDPLLAQVLLAATYPEQLEAAYQLRYSPASIEGQPWDISVKAVARYPDVFQMMASNINWTIAVGQAYVTQPDDVARSIQRLRAQARQLGHLQSTAQHTVAVTDGYISIVPAQPRYIYVPRYDPGIVYLYPRTTYPSAFTFGAGLLIGAWLSNAFDWNRGRVYHHGWRGGGWIGRSRPHVRWDDRRYVNPSWRNRPLPGNRRVRDRDVSRYRQAIGRGPSRFTPPGDFDRRGRGEVPRTRPAPPPTRPDAVTTPPRAPTRRSVTPRRPARPGAVTTPQRAPARPSVTPRRPARAGTGPGFRPDRATRPSTTVRQQRQARPRTVTPRRTTPARPSATVRRGAGPGASVSRPAPSPRSGVTRARERSGAGRATKAPQQRQRRGR